MRKLYHEYFYIPKGGKIREKVMLTRVATTVLIVVLCLVAMGFSAYAYFSADLTSSPNTLTAASFDITVSIVETESRTPVAVNAFKAELTADKTYEVTLRHDGTAKTGYAIITAESYAGKYYTTQLVKDEKETITFSITPDADTTVTFLAYWGTSSYYTEYLEKKDAYVNPFFILGGGEVVLVTQADPEPTVEEPAADTKDEKEPLPEASKPSAPVESVTSEPSAPAGSTESPASGPSEPAESETPDPAEPTEGTVPEPTEPDEPAVPEEPEPVEPTDPTDSTEPTEPETSSPEPEPEPTEPTEPETSGDGSVEQSQPEPEPSEGADAPAGEPNDGPADEPITEPGE